MADREKQIRLFRRIADQRLIAADFLLQNGFSIEAVYLAGYTVECSLKVPGLRWTPDTNFETVLEQLTEVVRRGMILSISRAFSRNAVEAGARPTTASSEPWRRT